MKFLLEKIRLFEDILNTSKVMDQIDRSMLITSLHSTSTQTDCISSNEFQPNSEISATPSLSDSTISLLPMANRETPCTMSNDNLSVNCGQVVASEEPIEVADELFFSNFCVDTLLEELSFSHNFGNRQAVYFGSYPYTYTGGVHQPKALSPDSYLAKICAYLDVILPNYEYNSALVNMYSNGEDFIPRHSDCEDCIEDLSDILTVSLGATRTLLFTNSLTGEVVKEVELKHGSLNAMSKHSQSLFKHELLPDMSCSQPRVSITFRLIKPRVPERHRTDNHVLISANGGTESSTTCGYVPFGQPPPTPQPVNSRPPEKTELPLSSSDPVLENASKFGLYPMTQEKQQPDNPVSTHTSSALYISSSMFRHLNTDKLSSRGLRAQKLFYPGANAELMLKKLKEDISLVKGAPDLIYIMCGTNNVDKIYYGSGNLVQSAHSIQRLITFVKTTFPTAKLNVVNILPRLTPGRNDVVNELNVMISEYCESNSINFMKTNYLFNLRNGERIDRYFMSPNKYTRDNCHLNWTGIARFGKFLKYWTYKHLQD